MIVHIYFSMHMPVVLNIDSIFMVNIVRVRVRVTLQLTVSQSVSLGVEPNLGLLTRYLFFFFFESYCPVIWGRPL
jgi:hypothetical protein